MGYLVLVLFLGFLVLALAGQAIRVLWDYYKNEKWKH